MTSFAAISWDGLTVATASAGGWLVEQPLTGPGLRCLAADPLMPGRLYAGRDGEGLLRSDDAGHTWVPAGLRDRHLRAVAASPTVAGRVYAGTRPPGLHVSDDAGASWRELPALAAARRWYWLTPAEPITPYVQAIALSPESPQVLLVGIETGAVLLSEDGGQTFGGHRHGALRDCHTLAFHRTSGATAYQGGFGGGRVSLDGGRTWRRPPRGPHLRYGWAAAGSAADPSTWWFTAAPGAMKAHGGKNAEAQIYRCTPTECARLDGGLPSPLLAMPYSLVGDPQDPHRMYAGLSNGEVWQTDDLGDAWTRLEVHLGRVERVMVAF